MISFIFMWCMVMLERMAAMLDPITPGGMSYEKINVILFCFIGPAIFLASVALNILSAIRIRKLKRKLKNVL